MAPDAGKMLEVRLSKSGTVGIVPETDGHTRHWRSQHQFANLIPHRIAEIVPSFDRCAQPPALQLSRINGKPGMRKDEGRTNVCSSAHRTEPDVWLDLVVHPLETIVGQW